MRRTASDIETIDDIFTSFGGAIGGYFIGEDGATFDGFATELDQTDGVPKGLIFPWVRFGPEGALEEDWLKEQLHKRNISLIEQTYEFIDCPHLG